MVKTALSRPPRASLESRIAVDSASENAAGPVDGTDTCHLTLVHFKDTSTQIVEHKSCLILFCNSPSNTGGLTCPITLCNRLSNTGGLTCPITFCSRLSNISRLTCPITFCNRLSNTGGLTSSLVAVSSQETVTIQISILTNNKINFYKQVHLAASLFNPMFTKIHFV